MTDLYWLTDEQMERLRPFFPKSHGRPRVDDRRVLSGIVSVAARNSPQKHVWQVRIVLLTAQGLGTQAFMGATGKLKHASGAGSSGSWPKRRMGCSATRSVRPAARRSRPLWSTRLGL